MADNPKQEPSPLHLKEFRVFLSQFFTIPTAVLILAMSRQFSMDAALPFRPWQV